jgi:GNAT superfamily N-acetyltransferase
VSAPADTTLRPVGPADLAAMRTIVAACDESWREWTPPGWAPPPVASQQWIEHLGAADRWTRLAVGPGGRVIGLVSWGAARGAGPGWELLPGVAYLAAVFVHPSCWRRGLATRLLDAALDAMRAAGYARARLNTPVGAPAERFYAARGWTRGSQPRWHEGMKLPVVQYSIDL